ncbi:carbohydrate-binding family 9-like protein, partial [Clostridium perfringens]|uniref:carbohydrate-binding family 9-like protein n=1 Tax=Clostridium perfringens TaxID=1502 RepID=UPI002AC44E55
IIFYFAAELIEDQIWATLTERDSVIFYDNDFEIFIDPDGDSHQYYEFEINALNTVWDLLLVKPYRDGGPPVNGWDISGLKTAVFIDGELSRPGADNRKWRVAVAIPWTSLKECAEGGRRPAPGEFGRVNFSRGEWQTEVQDG